MEPSAAGLSEGWREVGRIELWWTLTTCGLWAYRLDLFQTRIHRNAALRASIHLRSDLELGQRPAGAVAYGIARRLGASPEESRLLSRLAGGDRESLEEDGDFAVANGRPACTLGKPDQK